ncbi:MAG: hypothetical protein AAB966_02630, partial [Patescibacteria group bacterium]
RSHQRQEHLPRSCQDYELNQNLFFQVGPVEFFDPVLRFEIEDSHESTYTVQHNKTLLSSQITPLPLLYDRAKVAIRY